MRDNWRGCRLESGLESAAGDDATSDTVLALDEAPGPTRKDVDLEGLRTFIDRPHVDPAMPTAFESSLESRLQEPPVSLESQKWTRCLRLILCVYSGSLSHRGPPQNGWMGACQYHQTLPPRPAVWAMWKIVEVRWPRNHPGNVSICVQMFIAITPSGRCRTRGLRRGG